MPVNVDRRDRGDADYGPLMECDQADSLFAIRDSAVQLALWRRSPDPGIGDWLRSIPAASLPHGRVLVRPSDFRPALDEILETSGTPGGPGAVRFIDDVIGVANLFAEVAETAFVDIGLEPVQHDSCWKFHRDYVRLRIVTTYLGPGTQYVDMENSDVALEQQRDYRGPIHEMPQNTVALFKGAKFSNGSGIVHRSPPIAGTGTTRVVLTLNAPSNVSPTPWSEKTAPASAG